MNALNISSFIWGIADDVLRDHYVRGKYRDVILPMAAQPPAAPPAISAPPPDPVALADNAEW